MYSYLYSCTCSVHVHDMYMTCTCTLHVHVMYMYMSCTCTDPECLISSYGAPLAQSASYLALHSSQFGPNGAINYDYNVTNSINCLLIGSRCIPNGAHTNHC